MLSTFRRIFGFKPSAQVDRDFRGPLRQVIADLQAEGYTVVTNSLYRSPRYQQELHDRWEAGDPSVITEPAPPWESAHNYGMGGDLEPYAPGATEPDYDALAWAAENNGLLWAGWDDPGHVELPEWRARVRALRWNEARLVPL